jgi:hypothetical protein
LSERTAADMPLPGGNFRLFVQRLGLIGLQSLGLVENPLTSTRQVHLGNARMTVDDLLMLREKTEGNLEPEERAHLDKLIDDLRYALRTIEAQLEETERDEPSGAQP